MPKAENTTTPNRFVWQGGDIEKIDPAKVRIEMPAPRPAPRNAKKQAPAKNRP